MLWPDEMRCNAMWFVYCLFVCLFVCLLEMVLYSQLSQGINFVSWWQWCQCCSDICDRFLLPWQHLIDVSLKISVNLREHWKCISVHFIELYTAQQKRLASQNILDFATKFTKSYPPSPAPAANEPNSIYHNYYWSQLIWQCYPFLSWCTLQTECRECVLSWKNYLAKKPT